MGPTASLTTVFWLPRGKESDKFGRRRMYANQISHVQVGRDFVEVCCEPDHMNPENLVLPGDYVLRGPKVEKFLRVRSVAFVYEGQTVRITLSSRGM